MNKVVLSFSGGKDSCLALHRLIEEGLHVTTLVTTVMQNKTVAHSEPLDKITEQAQQLGIPIEFIETDFESYHHDFISKLASLKKRKQIDTIAFGDIYLTGHREWGEELAKQAQLTPYYPIWTKQENIADLLKEFIDLGYLAEVIKVDAEKLPTSWVGKTLDSTLLEALKNKKDMCLMGESGEYHTFVYDGPLFKNPVSHEK